MFIYIRPNKDISGYNEGALKIAVIVCRGAGPPRRRLIDAPPHHLLLRGPPPLRKVIF